MKEITTITFADNNYLMWAEPDDGSYNWQLYCLGSRYDHERQSIPREVRYHIKEHASEYYPIMIVDGAAIDSLLDRISLTEKDKQVFNIRKAWGQVPRVVNGGLGGVNHKINSVEEFLKEYPIREHI